MEEMTEEWHNRFGVFRNGFGQFEYILERNLNFNLRIIFTQDYIMLRQTTNNPINDDIISIWNKDLVKRNIYVHEWKALYLALSGEELTETEKV